MASIPWSRGPANLTTDNAAGDAFGRLRVSNPLAIFDSKQTSDGQPLLWDNYEISGSGGSASHNPNEAATRINSTLNTATNFIRQTYMRFNYQPGKSQLVILTGNLQLSGGGVGSGVKRYLGLGDDDNGLYFLDDGGTVKVVIRSNYTGSPIDIEVPQNEWDDPMDGNGASGIKLDFTKANIFVIDMQWLGVGRVRFGFDVEGVLHYCHSIDNANQKEGVYMSTPNLPLRFQLITTASSPASSMSAICCSVMSEGGEDDNGILRYASSDGTAVATTTSGTIYAVLGMRIKSGYLGTTIKQVRASLLAASNQDVEWMLILNPTVAGTFTYGTLANSAVDIARGAVTNTVTGGTPVDGGYVSGNDEATNKKENAIYLGAAGDGTLDTLVFCARPLANNVDIYGSLTWREIF